MLLVCLAGYSNEPTANWDLALRRTRDPGGLAGRRVGGSAGTLFGHKSQFVLVEFTPSINSRVWNKDCYSPFQTFVAAA